MKESQNDYYNQEYYKNYCGVEYERGHGWEEIFANHAERIVKEINPQKTLDIGCAKGFLVEALRDRNVEAFGIDLSDYAISKVREDIRPYCKVQSVLMPIPERYDLITCIEVLEHLENQDISLAIQRMCSASDDIIFSSTPFEYNEESHKSVHTLSYWAEQFAYHGFYHDVQYDCSYICVQAMRFRRNAKDKIDLIRDYENILFQKHQELTSIRQRYKTSMENVQIYKEAYQKHVDMINMELNPKIQDLSQKLNEAEWGITESIKENLEDHYRNQIEEEIKKRRYFEERYYKSIDNHKEIEDGSMELLNIASQEIALMRQGLQNGSVLVKLWHTLHQYYRSKRLERKLMRKSVSYWKPIFDPKYYADHNKDLSDKYGMDERVLLKHFICFGMYEGRRANDTFDINVYMRCNPDVVKTWKFDKRACYLHYITDGIIEGRTAI